MPTKYNNEVAQLRDKVATITGYVSNLYNKALLEKEYYIAIACADFISNTTRAFEYITDQCEEENK